MSNKKINLNDVKQLAFESIEALKNGSMNVQTAAEIRNNLNVIVEVAKVEVAFINQIPKLLKDEMKKQLLEIASTVHDADGAALDRTLKEIAIENSKPYKING